MRKIILLAAILLFSHSCKEKESDKYKDIGYACKDGSDTCTFARMCRGIKDIKEEHLKEIKECVDICNGIEDTMLRCIPEISTIRDYPCKDGTDSCEIAKLKKELLESLDEILSKSEKERQSNRKLQCEVFGCHIAKDSSFLMITEYDIISRYNRKYLLINSDEMSVVSGLVNGAEVGRYYSPRISEILPDCKLSIVSSASLKVFSEDSKCDLAPLLAKFPSGTNSFCFEYLGNKYSYYNTLMKENGSIDKILKLKSDKLGTNYICDPHTLKFFGPEEDDFDICLYYLNSIRTKYDYDFLYISSFDKPRELCDLERWRGVRLKEQSKKNMSLKSLFVAPKNCVWY